MTVIEARERIIRLYHDQSRVFLLGCRYSLLSEIGLLLYKCAAYPEENAKEYQILLNQYRRNAKNVMAYPVSFVRKCEALLISISPRLAYFLRKSLGQLLNKPWVP